jgi:hypothetical protein
LAADFLPRAFVEAADFPADFFPKADSQLSEYFFDAPIRTIVTVDRPFAEVMNLIRRAGGSRS